MTAANKEKTSICNFIKCLSEENYATANKYLKEAVQVKLFKKMKQFKDFNLDK
tara:strand:+ start:193 stop:351 length:159 start_codon:yes stop_codon:yes gene_type:complete